MPRSAALRPYLANNPASRAAQSGNCAEPRLNEIRIDFSSWASARYTQADQSAQKNKNQALIALLLIMSTAETGYFPTSNSLKYVSAPGCKGIARPRNPVVGDSPRKPSFIFCNSLIRE